MLLAERHPECVASFVNVEGNFTLKDAFFTAQLARMSPEEADALVAGRNADPAQWLEDMGIAPEPWRLRAAERGLAANVGATLRAVSQSLVEITAQDGYLEMVARILDRGTPMHLLAGEHSREAWDVPDFVLRRAASLTLQPGAGHLMMMEEPEAFLDLVAGLVGRDEPA